ncbi:hypothetical protein [Yersinia phage MHG19]|nr:hypothetical protein [Yersinia phage MHG19]
MKTNPLVVIIPVILGLIAFLLALVTGVPLLQSTLAGLSVYAFFQFLALLIDTDDDDDGGPGSPMTTVRIAACSAVV